MRKYQYIILFFVLSLSQGIAQTCSLCNSNHKALLNDGTNLEVVGQVSVNLISGRGLNPLSIRLLQPSLYTIEGTKIPLSRIQEVYHENSAKEIALSEEKIDSIIKITNSTRRISIIISLIGIILLVR